MCPESHITDSELDCTAVVRFFMIRVFSYSEKVVEGNQGHVANRLLFGVASNALEEKRASHLE